MKRDGASAPSYFPVNHLPPQSVRGAIRTFVAQHADLLGADVLECGSRRHDPIAWWTTARDLAAGKWTGIDLEPGDNVDVVADLHHLPGEWAGRFTGVLCSETLEHVRRPVSALRELYRVMRPGAALIVTTLTAFPIHNFPHDYRRWTEEGLRVELEDAGFDRIVTSRAGSVRFCLNDHGERGETVLDCPIHVFAAAFKPC